MTGEERVALWSSAEEGVRNLPVSQTLYYLGEPNVEFLGFVTQASLQNPKIFFLNFYSTSAWVFTYGSGDSFIGGGKAPSDSVLHYVPGCHELEQVVRAACLRAKPRHLEASEWMALHQGTGAAAIDIKVADTEFPSRFGDVFRASREYCTRQGVLRAVCHLQGFLEVFDLDDGKYGTEDFFLCQAVFRTDIGNNGEGDEERGLRVE